jgi:Ras-related protein Rab-1A
MAFYDESICGIGLIGDPNVGKTEFHSIFFNTEPIPLFDAFEGVDVYAKDYSNQTHTITVRVGEVWEITPILNLGWKLAHAIALMFDTTNSESFTSIKNKWGPYITKNTPKGIPLILIGTRSDLSKQREVPFSSASKYAQIHNMYYFETSTKYKGSFVPIADMLYDLIYLQTDHS